MNAEEEVLSWLEDEESKFIFEKRTQYNESGNDSYIAEIIDKYVPEFRGRMYQTGMEKKLIADVCDRDNIVLWGGGVKALRIINILESSGIKVNFIIDNDECRQGTYIEGIRVVAPNSIDIKNIDCLIISPNNMRKVMQIYKQAVDLGMKEDCIIKFMNYCRMSLHEEQYFDEDIIHFEKEEVFCDVGTLNLDTSIEFYNKCIASGTEKIKIYAFEPDADAYMHCKSLCDKQMDIDITLHNVALWNCDTILHFSQNGAKSRITNGGGQDTEVRAMTLDSCIADDKVTFIKMDIEGAELEALQGAREIIKKNKPKLAICVYHKKKDLIQIPLYIKGLVPEYKLYLRHYSNSATETVLYAVI